MQNNDTETYDKIDDPQTAKKLRALGETIIEIGREFILDNTTYRIRKITTKDIICRPVAWNQNEENNENQ